MTMINGMDRENLQTLATFLAYGELPAEVRFTMARFCDAFDNLGKWMTDCGSAGCAVGFAPFAGIEKRPDEDFYQYSQRTLINDNIYEEEWQWCFGHDWKYCDNTPLGAAKRIQYLLDRKRVPGDFDSTTRASEFELFVDHYADITVKGEQK